ncbi:MAG: ABC transporter permease [Chloroflexota bacterium]|nr:ABC transporter permease [Chloroflexota bacterium]
MSELWDGITKAVHLLVSLDSEVMGIAGRSLWISATSCCISFLLISLPLGSLIHFNSFTGKKLLISTIQTLFSLPAVAIGLIVFVLFSRAGPLGVFGIYLTPWAIIIGQVMLITPVMLGLIISALTGIGKAIPETAIALGANRFQTAVITIREARYAIFTALVMGFGRAVSEVGISLMVGGNFAGYTRTLTTAISLETSKGDLEFSLALGFILIFIALFINIALLRLQQR